MGLDLSQWHDISNFFSINSYILDKMHDLVKKNKDFKYSHLNINGQVIDLFADWLS